MQFFDGAVGRAVASAAYPAPGAVQPAPAPAKPQKAGGKKGGYKVPEGYRPPDGRGYCLKCCSVAFAQGRLKVGDPPPEDCLHACAPGKKWPDSSLCPYKRKVG